jgi:hypothetical protein
MDNHPPSSRIRPNRGQSQRVPITRLATAPANPETPSRLRSPDMCRRQRFWDNGSLRMGYIRTSNNDQNPELQRRLLRVQQKNLCILRLPIAQIQRTYHGRGHNLSEGYWSGPGRTSENSVNAKFSIAPSRQARIGCRVVIFLRVLCARTAGESHSVLRALGWGKVKGRDPVESRPCSVGCC